MLQLTNIILPTKLSYMQTAKIAEKIGLLKKVNLLAHLTEADMRYGFARSLQKEISDLGALA